MRRIFLRTFVFFFTLLLFFIIYKSSALAGYSIIAVPEAITQPTTTEARAYLYGDTDNIEGLNSQAVVDENTQTVRIKFSGLVAGKKYIICLTSECPDKATPSNLRPGSGQEVQTEERDAKNDSTLTLDVCADGKNKLKLLEEGGNCDNGSGDDGDYFWGRHSYRAVIYDSAGSNLRIGSASFYVSQYYPKVVIDPLNGKPTPNDELKVTIIGTKRPHERKNRNNYAVEIAHQDDPVDIDSQECIDVPNNSIGETVTFGRREEGDYIIKVNEQANEGNDGRDDCSAEFTYYWIKIHVRNNHDRNPELNKMEIIPDPNGTELAGLTKKKKAPPPPCATAFSESGNCPKVKTGIGIDIGTSPREFVKSIFSLILGISGGIALLLIIYSGYLLMVSRAKPEALKDAQDQLIAAIVGLVFIIFSLVVLQIIGVDILKIPGFNP